MTFSDQMWESTAVLRKAIDDLPFLTGLADGTLPREVFTSYLAQDAHYLADYGRVLALAASQADTADDLLLWAGSAHTAVAVERELHERHVGDIGAWQRSPTCTAYGCAVRSPTRARSRRPTSS